MSDPVAAAGDLSCEREMARAARRHAVPLGVLYAVALNESGRNGRLNPYALNVAGRSIHAASLAEALGHFDAARARGIRLIDVGCMQVNLHHHPTAFASLEEALDPTANAQYAARFLHGLFRNSGSWGNAVARYHASIYGWNLQYRNRVMRIWHSLRAR